MFHLREADLVVVQVFSECSIQRCDRVCSLDTDGTYYDSVFVNAHNLGGGDTYVDTNYYFFHFRDILF